MNMNVTLSILGLLGGMLCTAGDLLAGILGKGNRRLGKNMQSNWVNIPDWKVNLSQILGTAGSLLIGCGFYSFARQMQGKSVALYLIFFACTIASVLFGPMVHYTAIVPILICKELIKNKQIEIAESIVDRMNRACLPILLIFLPIVVGGGSIGTIVAIVKGYFGVPLWFVIFNQLLFVLARAIVIKATKGKVGILPGMSSIGITLMLGLVGIVGALY